MRQTGMSGSPPVSRVLLCANAPATIHLGDVLPRRSSSLPGSDASRVMASLFGLAPDGVLRAVRVAAHAVGSYPALPPARRRTISTLPDPCGHWRYVFCSTFRRLGSRLRTTCSARPLAGILLCGARTFLRACAPRLPGGLPGRIVPARQVFFAPIGGLKMLHSGSSRRCRASFSCMLPDESGEADSPPSGAALAGGLDSDVRRGSRTAGCRSDRAGCRPASA